MVSGSLDQPGNDRFEQKVGVGVNESRHPNQGSPSARDSDHDSTRRWDQGPAFWLRWLLAITGCGLMVATLPVFFPVQWSATIHGWLGLGEFPQGPITVYLARSTSMLYAVHGSLMLYVSLDMKRYWPMVRVFGWLHVIMGLTMFGIDVTTPMPTYWIIGEGIPIALAGLLIIWLWNKSNATVTGQR